MTFELPSSEELQNSARNGDIDKCHKLVLEAITYGTQQQQQPEVSSNENDNDSNNRNSKKLHERTQEACNRLADAWEDCLELEDVLVDALWLSGSMITSMVTTAAEAASTAKATAKQGSDAASTAATVTTNPKQSLDALIEIVKALVQIPNRNNFWIKLQGNLMPSIIDAVGLAPQQEFLKKLKIHNTQVHYKQQKYNLLQEESEGYSKVLTYFASCSKHDYDDKKGSIKLSGNDHLHLKKLLGTFELDPNRVLDLAIDYLEATLYPNNSDDATNAAGNDNYNHSNNLQGADGESSSNDKSKPEITNQCKWLFGIMKELCVEKLPALIGFKQTAWTSPSFLRTVAILASEEGLLDLTKLRNEHFGRLAEEITECHKAMWLKEKNKIVAMSRISLTGTTAKVDPKMVELEEKLEALSKPLKSNLFLEVLLLLLHWGEWRRIKPLFQPDIWSQLCSIMPEEFGFALCDVAQERIQNWLRAATPMTTLCKSGSSSSSAASEQMEGVELEVSIDEVVEIISDPLLCVVHSGCIGFRPILFCQMCRLFRLLLNKTDTEHHLSGDTYDFFKKIVVPAMSLFPSNPAISTELWSVLRCLPYATRYRLYEDWRGAGLERAGLSSSPNGKPLPNVLSEMEAGKAARYALKRLSKDNIRDMSRQLAKVTHSNPLVVFATILSQIESYDNMVEVMVEAQRFVNPLGLDVLGYCILGRLSGKTGGINRSRLKDDGVNVSQWLQSLESFTGAFFRRCPFVEFRGMLCYLMRRLREGNVMELGILRTLLKVTGGYSFADYSPAASLNVTQLEGRAGSRMLKIETMSFGIVEEKNVVASDRIRHVLQTAGFGVSMLIHIAQVRSRILFETTKNSPKEVKLVGNLYDSCQVVMSILLDFLIDCDGQSDDKKDQIEGHILRYAECLPTLDALYTKYGVDIVSTWMLCRPLVRSANRVDPSNMESSDGNALEKLKRFAFSDDFRKSYKAMLPENVWSILSFELFEYFYTHGIYDLFCPENIYENELNRVNKEIERLQRLKGGSSNSLHAGPVSQKDDAEELGRLKSVSSGLTSDLEKQKKHVAAVESAMDEMKSSFFPENGTLIDLAKNFFVHCILPRSTQSPDDAMYCARFSFRLHRLECPRFSTLHYIDQLISVVSGSLFGVTEGEAAHLAILLWESWKVVNKWRYEDGLYDAEVAGKPGSVMLVPASDDDENSDLKEQEVSRDDFSVLYNKWHASLGSALIGCLRSSEYMHSRAGLVVLTRIVEVFPTRPVLGNRLLRVLEPLQDESSARPDIRASANAYGTMLLKARDEGKWVEEDAAVAKARADKERMAAETRKRKIAEQFQELERDSEQITKEIGTRDNLRDRHDRGRERDHGGIRGGPRGPTADADRNRPLSLASTNENGKPRIQLVARTETAARVETGGGRMESGEVPSSRDHDDRQGSTPRRPSPPRDVGRVTDREHDSSFNRTNDRQHTTDNWRRDGNNNNNSNSNNNNNNNNSTTHRTTHDEAPRGLAGRWSTPVSVRGGRTAKRSRPSTPEPAVPDSRTNDRLASKRPRITQDNERSYETHRDTRGSSPPRRPRSPQTSSRARSRRNTKR